MAGVVAAEEAEAVAAEEAEDSAVVGEGAREVAACHGLRHPWDARHQ
jgi:hypothetical protein